MEIILIAIKICNTASISSSGSMMDCNPDIWTVPCDEHHVIKNVMDINRCHIECLFRHSAKALRYHTVRKECTCIPDWPGISYNQYTVRRSCMVGGRCLKQDFSYLISLWELTVALESKYTLSQWAIGFHVKCDSQHWL